MKIVIAGDGKVGHSLAESLSQEEHDIIVIDNDSEALSKSISNLDVMCVKGSAISTRTLSEAQVSDCDLMIAVTTNDELNMLCCLLSKRLGAKHTISRIRDPEYAEELSLLKKEIELDMVINPEQATAREISRLIKFSPAMNVEKFSRGRVEMIELSIQEGMPIEGKLLKDISGNIIDSVLIGAVERDGELIIPSGDFRLTQGDSIHVIGEPSKVYHFTEKIGIQIKRIKDIIIIGGGRIAYYLAKSLDDLGIKVKIIEYDYNRCVELTELLPHCLIINGDGTDEDFLLSENLENVDAFVTLTGRDEDNLVSAIMAKHHGVAKVIAKTNRITQLGLIKEIGIDCVVSPKLITADNIITYVRGLENAKDNPVNTIYRVINSKAEAAVFTVPSDAKYVGKYIKKLAIPSGMLIGAIIRKNVVIIPKGKDSILAGDTVILLSKESKITDLKNIIDIKQ